MLTQLLLQGPGHMRTISLDTSASNFLQSLQLHDVSALQAGMLDAAEAAALDQQYDAAAMAAASRQPYSTTSPKFAGTAAAATAAGDHAWQPAEGAAVSAGSKRAHSSNGRIGKESLQEGKKESLHQHKHSFTPALPAVEETEDAAGPSDRCETAAKPARVPAFNSSSQHMQRSTARPWAAAQLCSFLLLQWKSCSCNCHESHSTFSYHHIKCQHHVLEPF
jgi:hypothetical protein